MINDLARRPDLIIDIVASGNDDYTYSILIYNLKSKTDYTIIKKVKRVSLGHEPAEQPIDLYKFEKRSEIEDIKKVVESFINILKKEDHDKINI